jgi:hypothetical protein
MRQIVERYQWEMLTMDMGVATKTIAQPQPFIPTAIQVVPLMSGVWDLTVSIQSPHQPPERTTFPVNVP